MMNFFKKHWLELIGLILLIVVSYYLFIKNDENLTLTITMIVVVIYTYFTYRIVRESVILRENNIKPLLYAYVAGQVQTAANETDIKRLRIEVENIGNGFALEVFISMNLENIGKAHLICGDPHFYQKISPRKIENDSRTVLFDIPKEKQNFKSTIIIECKDIVGNEHIFKYSVK